MDSVELPFWHAQNRRGQAENDLIAPEPCSLELPGEASILCALHTFHSAEAFGGLVSSIRPHRKGAKVRMVSVWRGLEGVSKCALSWWGAGWVCQYVRSQGLHSATLGLLYKYGLNNSNYSMISEQLIKHLKLCQTQYKWCVYNNCTDSLFWH